MNWRLAFTTIFIASIALSQGTTNSQLTTPGFDVRWIPVDVGLTSKTYEIVIQNMDPDSSQQFDLSILIAYTDFDISEITDITMHEWKSVDTVFPTYATNLTNQLVTVEVYENSTVFIMPPGCYWSMINESIWCAKDNTYQNGTVIKAKNQWKRTKMALVTQPDRVTADYGNITIPKYGSKAKTDDFNVTETVNGTKRFRITFNTPIVESRSGWGNSGLLGIYDDNTGQFYHPWWDVTWAYRQCINISDLEYSSYPLFMNITNASINNNSLAADFADIRFLNLTDGVELDYWFEYNTSGANSNLEAWVEIDGNFCMYYGNADAKYKGNFTATFEVGDEIVSDTTGDYTTSQTAGTFAYDATCDGNALPSGESVQCLSLSKGAGSGDQQALYDVGHGLKNVTFVSRYIALDTDSGAGDMRVGMSTTNYPPTNNAYFMVFGGNWNTWVLGGNGPATDIPTDTEDEWFRVQIDINWTGDATGNYSNWTFVNMETGHVWNDLWAWTPDPSLGDKGWFMVYDNNAPVEIQIDFWFIDQFDDAFTYVRGAEESVPVAAVNTSLLGASFNISDFSFASLPFVTAFNGTFTLTEAVDAVLMSSMNIEKVSAGGNSVVSIRVTVDGTVILTEAMRTVSTVGDVGSVAITPIEFTAAAGEHNITYEFSRTGVGTITIDNIDAILLQNISNDGNSVRLNVTPAVYTHSSTDFTTSFNWTIPKAALSRTYYTIKQTVTKATPGTSTLSYFFEDITENHTSPFWQRILSSASDVGSVAGVYMDEAESGNLNYTIRSRQTDVGDTVSVNGTILDIDMIDSDDNEIPAFQMSDELTNLSTTRAITAGDTLLATATVTIGDGDAYFLSMMTSFSSASGAQTPTYFINSTNSTVLCTSSKQRSLSDSDIGNAVIYMLCEGLAVDSEYIFNLYITVAAGETVTQIDESFSGFEVQTFNLTILNTPPIVAILDPDEDEILAGDFLNINWSTTDLQGHRYLTNVSIVNSTDTLNISTQIGDHISNITWNSTTVNDGIYNLTVLSYENVTAELLSGSDTIEIIVLNNVEEVTVCDVEPILIFEGEIIIAWRFDC